MCDKIVCIPSGERYAENYVITSNDDIVSFCYIVPKRHVLRKSNGSTALPKWTLTSDKAGRLLIPFYKILDY